MSAGCYTGRAPEIVAVRARTCAVSRSTSYLLVHAFYIFLTFFFFFGWWDVYYCFSWCANIYTGCTSLWPIFIRRHAHGFARVLYTVGLTQATGLPTSRSTGAALPPLTLPSLLPSCSTSLRRGPSMQRRQGPTTSTTLRQGRSGSEARKRCRHPPRRKSVRLGSRSGKSIRLLRHCMDQQEGWGIVLYIYIYIFIRTCIETYSIIYTVHVLPLELRTLACKHDVACKSASAKRLQMGGHQSLHHHGAVEQ